MTVQAIDNKHNIIGQLGAIEILLTNGIPIQRTIFIAIGHDEEIGGVDGAAKIAQHLSNQQIQFEFVLDEGPMIVYNALPGLSDAVALIANAEKGSMNVEMSITGPGGHSSMPPVRIKEESLMMRMATAIHKIHQFPMTPHFGTGSSFRSLFEFVAQRLKFPFNIICSNFWCFGPIFKQILLRASPGAKASIQTSSIVTLIHGGTKLNVIPDKVKAYINHRVHPLDTIERVLAHDK